LLVDVNGAPLEGPVDLTVALFANAGAVCASSPPDAARTPPVVVGAAALTFPAGTPGAFDVVLCAETLEHLPPDALGRAVAELRRVARRAVVVTTPWKERLEEGRARCPDCGTEFHLYGHLHSFGPDDPKALFPGAAGYDVRGSWRVRPYAPALLHIRHRWLDQRPWSRHAICPRCHSRALPRHDRRLGYRALDTLNIALHPRRDRFNWVLVRIWLSTETAS
jgi:hypothetical protein